MSGDHFLTGLEANSPTISIPGKSQRPPLRLLRHSMKMLSSSRDTLNMPHGDLILLISVTHMVILMLRWRLMESEVSVFLQKHSCSEPVSIFPHSLSRGTLRLRVLEKSVTHALQSIFFTNFAIDGKAHEVLGRWTPTLHHLASLRAFSRRS